MKQHGIKVGLASLALCCVASAQAPKRHADRIPDEATAIRIGEKQLSYIYGKKQILSEEPFTATLENGIWTVTGSMPPDILGGVAVLRLKKKTGRIISYIHYQ